MARPTVAAPTERTYDRLPEHYRHADERQGAGANQYPLLRFLSLLGDQAGELEDFYDRFDHRSAGEDPHETPELATDVALEAEAMTETGGWTTAADIAGLSGSRRYTSAAVADQAGAEGARLDGTVTLEAGTYEIVVDGDQAGPDRGQANVAIDGGVIGSVDQYAAGVTTPPAELVVATLVLAEGDHDVTFDPLGTKVAASTGYRVGLDRLIFRMVAVRPDTSDLVDPDYAADAWLDWLGQLVGLELDPSLSKAERRDAVRFASAGWRAGTTAGMEDAARSELTGTKYVKIYDHSASAGAVGAGTQWDVLVVTRPTETPAAAGVLAAINRKKAKPAGVILYWDAYEASWDVMTQAPARDTWTEIEALGSWEAWQEVGLS